MNQQPPQKPDFHPEGNLQLHSIFSTIQGEGPFTGYRAIFIRLAGCNLQCPMCDTEYTEGAREVTVLELLEQVGKKRSEKLGRRHLVVITGGEPFRQNLSPLVKALLGEGYEVQIETNGTLYQELPFYAITVVCSPKAGSINRLLAPYLSILKYVMRADQVSKEDGLPLFALEHGANPQVARPPEGFRGLIYLQPADEKDEAANQKNLQAVMESVLQYGYILQLQIHKLINVE